MKWLHWDVRQNSCRLSHSSFLGGHLSILTKDIFWVIECAKHQSLGLLRERLLLNLGIVVIEFRFYHFFSISIYIVFFVWDLSSEICQFSNLSFFHRYGSEVSGPNHDATILISVVLFLMVLSMRYIFVFCLIKLFSGVLSWFEIEIVTTFFEAIFLYGTQSSRRLLPVEITNAQVGLSREVDAVILAPFFTLGIEISRPKDRSTILVFIGSFRWKLVGISDGHRNWLREKTKTGPKIKMISKIGSKLT